LGFFYQNGVLLYPVAVGIVKKIVTVLYGNNKAGVTYLLNQLITTDNRDNFIKAAKKRFTGIVFIVGAVFILM
jgi:hypothetical protein